MKEHLIRFGTGLLVLAGALGFMAILAVAVALFQYSPVLVGTVCLVLSAWAIGTHWRM